MILVFPSCLCRRPKKTLATLTTLKQTPGMSPTAWPLEPNPATRTSSFSSIKFCTQWWLQPSLGTKGCDFCHSWWTEPWHISWWQNLDVWLQPLFFRAHFSWHEKCVQKGWPSGLCPNGLYYTVTMLPLGSSVATELPGKNHNTCSSYQHCGPERKTIMFNFNTSSEGTRMLGPPSCRA